MIGILIVAHGGLGESLVDAVTHVLGARPTQFGVFPVAADDDPLLLLPRASEAVAALDTGEGVAVFADLYGDSLGPPGSPGATYLGMERWNVRSMVAGFLGDPPPVG